MPFTLSGTLVSFPYVLRLVYVRYMPLVLRCICVYALYALKHPKASVYALCFVCVDIPMIFAMYVLYMTLRFV